MMLRPPTDRRSDAVPTPGEIHALAHAEEAETRAVVRVSIEPSAAVGDMQTYILPTLGQAHCRRPGSAVLDHVLQRLLRDAEQTQSRVRGYPPIPNSLSELDPYVAVTRHVVAEARDGRLGTDRFEPCRVEVVREATDVFRNVFRAFEDMRHRLGDRR